MATLRLLLGFLLAFALAGAVVASLLWPRYLTWDNTPAGGQALCNCADNTRQTADRLINGQLTGSAVGAVLGLGAGITFAVLRRKRAAAAPATAAAAPPPAPPKT